MAVPEYNPRAYTNAVYYLEKAEPHIRDVVDDPDVGQDQMDDVIRRLIDLAMMCEVTPLELEAAILAAQNTNNVTTLPQPVSHGEQLTETPDAIPCPAVA